MVGEMNYEYSGLSGDASEFAGKNIRYLSKKYGTPVIVYNMARIMENIRCLMDAFSGYAEKNNIDAKLKEMKMEVRPISAVIADYVSKGYIPITF